MSLWKIALRSIQQRGLASMLTSLSMALGVMLVVSVISIHGVVAESFRTNSSLGYNLIVGAKGGALQLTLNTVYYLSKPVENIPYDYYLEFKRQEFRDAALKHSFANAVNEARWQAIASVVSLVPGGAAARPARLAAVSASFESDSFKPDFGRDGKFSQFTGLAIPVCLGDYFGQYRVVGTVPEMFSDLNYGAAADQTYEFSEGRNFQVWSNEHSYFEAVVGSRVAREMDLKLGAEISPSHGDPDGEGHAQKFTVVGILAPTGTPNDRAVFINMEGFYLMDDHAKPIEVEEPASGLAALGISVEPEEEEAPEVADADKDPLPVERREVTAILLRTVNPIVAVGLPKSINKGGTAQCVAPIREIVGLFETIVGPIQVALLTMTLLICVVSGVSILVSIYNSMNDRKHEIAVMRALGASRSTVMLVILFESILLSLGGGILGWTAAHSLNYAASDAIEQRTGVSVGFFSFAPPLQGVDVEFLDLGRIIEAVPPEILLVPGLILLAIVVGFLPALAAYRTDVAKSLGA